MFTYVIHVRSVAGLVWEAVLRGLMPRQSWQDEKEMRVMAATQGLARNAVVMRITVGLSSRARRDLRSSQDRSGLSMADIVNRALTLYEFVDSRLAAGDQFLLRQKGAGGLELVQFS